MKKLMLLITLIIMGTSCYCQIGYPRIIKWGSDSVVAITFDQLKKVNITKVERDSYKEISDSLGSQISLYKAEVKIGKEIISNSSSIILLKDTLIAKEQKINLILTDENVRLQKALKKEKTTKTLVYAIGGTIIAVLTGTVIYFGAK